MTMMINEAPATSCFVYEANFPIGCIPWKALKNLGFGVCQKIWLSFETPNSNIQIKASQIH